MIIGVIFPSLNVRILVLVRDPRGTIQSRLHRKWCPGRDDCENPETLCRDLVEDHDAAKDLVEKFPGRIMCEKLGSPSYAFLINGTISGLFATRTYQRILSRGRRDCFNSSASRCAPP